VSQDESGLTAREVLEELLHPESSHIVVSVADSAGNLGVDTLEIILPYGAYHTTTPMGLSSGIGRDISICEDDGLLYVSVDRTIAIMDPLSFEMVGAYSTVAVGEELSSSLCIPGDPYQYVTSRVNRFGTIGAVTGLGLIKLAQRALPGALSRASNSPGAPETRGQFLACGSICIR